LIIVTPTVDGQWVKTLLPLVWRGTIPTVLLLDPASFGGAGDLTSALQSLSEWGIAHHVITRDVLNRAELHSQRQGDWKWRVTPSGRAIAARETLNQKWKVLA
jgi:hypothetical protein